MEPLPATQYHYREFDTASDGAKGIAKKCRRCNTLVGYVRKRWVSTRTVRRSRITYLFVPGGDTGKDQEHVGYGRVKCDCGEWVEWFGPDAPRPARRIERQINN